MDLSPLKIDRSSRTAAARPRRRRGWLTPVVFLLLLAVAAWVGRKQIQGLLDRIQLAEVEVMQVRKSHPAAVGAVQGAAANGYVVAARRAALSADTPGRIVEMNVTEGSLVKQGDVVARLYADEYRAAVERNEAEYHSALAARERAQAGLQSATASLERRVQEEAAAGSQVETAASEMALAQIELDRFQKLVDEGVATVRELDQIRNQYKVARAMHQRAEAQLLASQAAHSDGESQVLLSEADLKVAEARVNVAQAEWDQARATLEKTEVRAPFDGIVVLKDAEIGEVVSPNSQGGSSARGSVVTMVDFASLEVQADVPETNLAAVRVKGRARVFLDAYPARPYQGWVDRIWPTANRQKATVEVRVRFDDPDEYLRPEMGARIVFLPEDEPDEAAPEGPPVMLIPEDAVVPVDGQSQVFVVERDVARLRPVTLGERRGGRVVVDRGLDEGELLVLRPPAELRDGDRVRRKES